MRSRTSAVLVAAVLATGTVGLAGCGSDSSSGDPIPTSTPDLAIPGGADQLPGGATGTATTSTTATTTTGTDTTATTTAPAASGGGTTTSAAPAPAPAAPAQ